MLAADKVDVVDCLLQAGADVNAVDGEGHSVLTEACYRGVLGVVDRLLLQGAM